MSYPLSTLSVQSECTIVPMLSILMLSILNLLYSTFMVPSDEGALVLGPVSDAAWKQVRVPGSGVSFWEGWEELAKKGAGSGLPCPAPLNPVYYVRLKSPTQRFSYLHWQNSWRRHEKPHCGAWDFPQGKGMLNIWSCFSSRCQKP